MTRRQVAERLRELLELACKAARIIPDDIGCSLHNYTDHEREAVNALLKRCKVVVSEVLEDR